MMRLAVIAALLFLPTAVLAEVKAADEAGFVIEKSAAVPNVPHGAVWHRLLMPSLWWSAAHTYSGSAANLTIEPKLGGCFCEHWPGGDVAHGRIIFIQPGRVLRLSAPLGPLQAMGVAATLSFTLEPDGSGTALHMIYVVGGKFTGDARALAPAVDKVLSEQFDRLRQLPLERN